MAEFDEKFIQIVKEELQKVLEEMRQLASGPLDSTGIKGTVVAELRDKDGNLKLRQETHNLVTDVGDQYSAKRVAGVSVTAMAGMKLGTSTTTPAKNGSGSYISTSSYISGSAKAFESGWPKISDTYANGAEFKVIWGAGQATSTDINEVAIVNNTTDSGEADASGTYARAKFSSTINKGSNDTLTVTWTATYTGS